MSNYQRVYLSKARGFPYMFTIISSAQCRQIEDLTQGKVWDQTIEMGDFGGWVI